MTARPLQGCTIAFDLDGTLVETAPDLIGALNVLLAECALPPLPLASARHLVGQGARVLIARGFAEAGEPLTQERFDPLFARFIEIYRGRIAEESFVFEGMEDALDALAADGATLSVCTNKPQALSVLLLDALGLTPRFAAVVGWDAVPTPKPDAGHLIAAVVRAGGALHRALRVGDSGTDLLTAQNARRPCLLVDWGYTDTPVAQLGGDAVVASPADIPAAVRRLLATGAAIR